MKRLFIALLVAGIGLLGGAGLAPAGTVRIDDPWIREAPPKATMLAAYMTITNISGEQLVLQAASSPDFKMITIHRTEMSEGAAHMMKQPALTIEAGKSVELKPGGYHLMLMKPQRRLTEGDEVQLQLSFNNGENVTVPATVRKQNN